MWGADQAILGLQTETVSKKKKKQKLKIIIGLGVAGQRTLQVRVLFKFEDLSLKLSMCVHVKSHVCACLEPKYTVRDCGTCPPV